MKWEPCPFRDYDTNYAARIGNNFIIYGYVRDEGAGNWSAHLRVEDRSASRWHKQPRYYQSKEDAMQVVQLHAAKLRLKGIV